MDNGLKNADDLLRGIFSHMGNVGIDHSPHIGANSSRIVFSTYNYAPDSLQDGFFEIVVSNLAGTIRQRLTEAEGVEVSPEWSPDGEYIAFLREAENICEMDKRGSRGVFVINDSGSDSPRVATLYNLGYRRDDTPDGRQVRRARVDGPLAWSPDGDSITFLQEEDLLDTEGP